MNGTPRVRYHTFGCKANQYDTERMRQEAEARGAVTVSDAADAADGTEDPDVLVVNTCTVTNRADAEARRYIRRAVRERPGLRVVVAGCSAALGPERYREQAGVVDVVGGHDPVLVANGILPGPTVEAPGPGLVQLAGPRSLDRLHREPIGGELLLRRAGATRGWLKVQDGCDRKCAFCATRLARGHSRSRPLPELLAEAALLADTHPEIVVTGIHIGHYGLDLDPRSSLSALVEALLEAVPNVRFRLGSVEATEVDDRLLELLEGSGGALAPHLHMPLQSGADPVLRRMRRWHTREAYRTRALEIAGRVSPLGLGADVITGFPGETAEDHARTRALVDELPFTYLHVFPYSPRAGTVAPELDGRVPQRVAGERSRDLRVLAQAKGEAYARSRVGSRALAVEEGRGGTALTGDYLRVGVGRRPGGDGSPVGDRGRLILGRLVEVPGGVEFVPDREGAESRARR